MIESGFMNEVFEQHLGPRDTHHDFSVHCIRLVGREIGIPKGLVHGETVQAVSDSMVRI